ncbi:sulfotransferase [Novosphingobium sp. G106]|uniref:sulfotransferase family protein n=1 Tax=Novosphingobium sp. G106 TaxID=2849500 RepID=UPI001C2CFE28|nr:sulfotransferase [Novosphingobium sp. G106]MBV1689875.1 sulfotransferase [Novosphingobium sp. G106]
MNPHPLSPTAEQLLARSREIADIELVDEEVVEPLTVLVRALNTEAKLDAEGARAYEAKFLRLLVNRLRMKRDFLAHPEIAEQEIAGPLVIMGVARSGTTKLQKVLAASGDFNFLTFWQNFNWASVSGTPGEPVDARIAEADAFCRWYDERSPETKLGHHFSALEPEEEGPLSEGCFVAPSFIGYAEMPSYAQWLADKPRSIFFAFLRDVLKYLQWQGLAVPGRPWLLKSPNYNGHEAAIREVFPNVRFVVANRSPVETLASMCKLLRCFRTAYGSPEVDNAMIVEGNYRAMEAHLANRAAHPEIPILDLRFQDIVGALPATIERIYAHAGMALTPSSRERILAWNAANAMHKHGEFRYSLGDAGLEEAVIRERMARYFELLERLDAA